MKGFLFVTIVVLAGVSCQDDGKLNAMDKIFSINKDLFTSGEDATFTTDDKTKMEFFEGDIIWTKRLKAQIGQMEANEGVSKFDAINNGAWPGGVVPYTFASGFAYQSIVRTAIAEYNAKTCIRFKPYTAALARRAGGYVEFMHGGGCSSYIGKQGRKQSISLGRGCNTKGVAVHEMMHALGFFHEQSRRDRDSYITINWSNINRAMWYNFKKYQPGAASTLGESYDKNSVMHYGNYAFSINSRPTIVSKRNSNEKLGQRNGLSAIDIRQLNKYYKCGGVTVKPTKTTTVVQNCNNKYSFCTSLTGWCTRHSFVKANCKKSCNLCDTRPTVTKRPASCIDTNSNCNYWKNQNYCRSRTYTSYMRKSCRMSCGLC